MPPEEVPDTVAAVAVPVAARPEPPVFEDRPNADAADLRDAALPAGAPRRVAARHILVSFQGAPAASPTVRRSRAAAEAQAQHQA